MLKTYLVEANKVADRRREEQTRKERGPEMGVLDVLAATNLPVERRRELIEGELDRIREYERELVGALAEGELADG